MKTNKLKDAFLTLSTLAVMAVLIFSTPQILRALLRTDYPLEVVVSNSMTPTLQVGDLLIIKGGFNGEEINVGKVDGDIIIFPRPGDWKELIAHRAVEKVQKPEGFYFRTKGDNNPMPDGWMVFEKDIVGKVVGRIPFIGYLFIFLQTSGGLALAVIALILLAFSDFIGLLK